jgi:hypothetical protein
MNIQAETRVQVSPNVFIRAFGEELVLLDFARGDYFSLDAIGAEIWRQLEAGKSAGAIADQLCARYEVARETAMKDVADLMMRLHAQGLILAA